MEVKNFTRIGRVNYLVRDVPTRATSLANLYFLLICSSVDIHASLLFHRQIKPVFTDKQKKLCRKCQI